MLPAYGVGWSEGGVQAARGSCARADWSQTTAAAVESMSFGVKRQLRSHDGVAPELLEVAQRY
jgi:hypothetical protein